MKAKSTLLYVSLVLNAALLLVLAWPRPVENLAFGQVAAQIGAYAAVSAKGGGNQDALWIANRTSGRMLVLQYQLGVQDSPVEVVGVRDLRDDLNERQIGNLMLVTTDISASTAVVYVIDTDADKMAIYQYNRSNRAVDGIQRMDLREQLTGTATTTGGAEATTE